jgi:hypothetical protein
MEITIPIMLLLLFIFLYLGRRLKINLYEQNFVVLGICGLSINYKDIYQIDIVTEIPEIGMRNYGYYFINIYKGYFIIENIGNVYLNLNLKNPPYIRIKLENGSCLFINLGDEKETKELCDNLVYMKFK